VLGGDDLGDAQIHLAEVVDGDEGLELAGLAASVAAAWAWCWAWRCSEWAGLFVLGFRLGRLVSAAGARESRLASRRASICLRSMRVMRWL
jgi:hypothetical protein